MSNQESEVLYTHDLNSEREILPTSHQPNITDSQLAEDYDAAIQKEGGDRFDALERAFQAENNRVNGPRMDRMKAIVEQELDALLQTDPEAWKNFWSGFREEERANYKAWIKANQDFETSGGYKNSSESEYRKYAAERSAYLRVQTYLEGKLEAFFESNRNDKLLRQYKDYKQRSFRYDRYTIPDDTE